MQQLHDYIFDVINKLWSDKRQLNENSVYNHILKTVEFLTAIQLEAGQWYKNYCSLPEIEKGNYKSRVYFMVIDFWTFAFINK